MTRVVIADDQALVRAGFARLLDAEADVEVVGEAADGRAAIDLCLRTRPDVVLMDVRMPVVDGITATREVTRATGTRVLVLTTYDLDEYVLSALQAGASGFLLKDSPPDELVRAIHVVAGGDSLISPRVTTRLVAEFIRLRGALREAEGLDRLTPREREVLDHLGRGHSNAEISAAMHVGETTVKTHVAAAWTSSRSGTGCTRSCSPTRPVWSDRAVDRCPAGGTFPYRACAPAWRARGGRSGRALTIA